MNADDRAVYEDVFEVRLSGYSLEQALKDTGLCPAAKAAEYAVPIAKTGWRIAPRAADANLPKHGLQKQAIVLPGYATTAMRARQERFDQIPASIRDDKAFGARPSLLKRNRDDVDAPAIGLVAG